jgi:transketolase
MRKTFIDTLIELAAQDARIVLLTGDLGFRLMEPYAERFPERFINVGVAEQNMVGIATGLAEAGLIPFAYSITPFAVLRPYEFIRNGPIYHQLPVRIVGAGGGFDYSHEGMSHFAVEDIGVLRVQPGIKIIVPADHEQARNALLQSWDLPGPIYYRLAKGERRTVPGLNGEFLLGRLQLLREGSDVLLVGMGSIATEVAAAADLISDARVTCAVAVLASVNPAPIKELEDVLARFPLVVTVEAHHITGGLGSLVAEVIADGGIHCRLLRCGATATPAGLNGSHDYLLQSAGLKAAQIAEATLNRLRQL